MKGLGFKKMEAYGFSKKLYFCKYAALVVINTNLWKLKKKNLNIMQQYNTDANSVHTFYKQPG